LRVVKEAAPSIPEHITPPSGRIVKTYSIEVITPIYGGWAKTGEYDVNNIIRAFSVRGNLRFWWRATRGASFESYEKLLEEENRIWGCKNQSTDSKSKDICAKQLADESKFLQCDKKSPKHKSTIINVKYGLMPNFRYLEDKIKSNENKPNEKNKKSAYGFYRYGEESYVLFPIITTEDKKIKGFEYKLVKEGFTFEITLSYDINHEKDVECAIWAWVNFGGIGARTRRGCGALYCEELAPEKPENFCDWFEENIKQYKLSLGTEREWSTLLRQILTGKPVEKPLDAWKNAIKPMRDFRQGERIGRNAGPGRSFWPEPDTLRRILKTHNTRHKPSDQIPNGFPRAAFGLPIIFSFRGSPGDPNSELYPQGDKRMGSPVILRPLKTRNKRSVPLAVFLKAPLPDGLELKSIDNEDSKMFSRRAVIDPNFTKYPNSPVEKRSANGNAIEAFANYFEKSFEVKR